ncbi:hypothetical protein DMZ43_03935 [Meridianimaribacter sp. CL38]|uniref:hypothetical protein n=1 Tax=Meridianimaribacter sp. CL38 TaxID=2213021 RepID=UPI00103B2D4D|nr:hypothetical protein [Meridianimaribacter sp. CL38]TBV28200.1 hypothetical protein DMZ43_03935 [Meridianimaribacter sp. CL38]
MTKKRIDTTLHYIQYIGARIALIGGIGFLIYSIWIKEIGAIIFCCLFVIYTLILMKRVFDKPNEIEFDDSYIYLKNGIERIELDKIIEIKNNRIIYKSGGIESKLKLPNFHFMDKKCVELKELIKKKKY